MQSAVGANLQGNPIAFGAALRPALVQSLAWIPVTLAVIALAARFPLKRGTWRRHLPVHALGVVAVAFVANLLVVLGFWWLQGRFIGAGALLRSAAMWATIRLHIALLIYAAIAAATQGVLYYRDQQARELQLARVESQLANARLEALNAQIRPHFLFNTLHTIGQLWRSGRNADADAMLDHLGNLFHRVQHATALSEVPLADELALVRDYLTIEQLRFRDRMQVSIDAPAETQPLLVPPLILQPLVENAVRHGISRAVAGGAVVVRARLTDGVLRLSVHDEGPGFAAPSEQRGTGTGLRNTRERLDQLYGPRAALDITSENGRGATVVITLPAHEH